MCGGDSALSPKLGGLFLDLFYYDVLDQMNCLKE